MCPTYGKVHFREFDFVLQSGANPNTVRLAYEGVDSTRTDENGVLVLMAGNLEMRQARPRIYQWVNGKQREVEGGYVMEGCGQVAFRVERNDAGATPTFPVPTSTCAIPSATKAYSVNFTVEPPGPLGYVKLKSPSASGMARIGVEPTNKGFADPY